MLIKREAISYDSPLSSAVSFGEFRDEGFDLRRDSDGLIHALASPRFGLSFGGGFV